MTRSRILPIAYQADATQVLERIDDLPHPVALDSSGRDRWDIISAAPAWVMIRSAAGQWSVTGDNGPSIVGKDREILRRAFAAASTVTRDKDSLPFCGGLIGYLGYEFAHTSSRITCHTQDDRGLPSAFIGRYDWAIVTDHVTQQSWLVTTIECAMNVEADIVERLSRPVQRSAPNATLLTPANSDIDRLQYRQCIDRIRHYLLAGDCYQVNFAQRYSARLGGHSLDAYRQLRHASPSPFTAYLDLGPHQILCMSPERFLRCDGKQVVTQPIKGTRPRHADARQDQKEAEALLNSAKDRAENVMIVDLLRNDLGQVCQPGSIKVDRLCELQSFANVHHLVSTVSGTLRDDRTVADLLLACFPGGSITGAPKQRAMEIIDELETFRRTIYCGSMFYLSNDDQFDSNIAIRTLLRDGDDIYGWAGGGIVFDSDAEEEYGECEHKIRGLFDALRGQTGSTSELTSKN